MMRKRKKDEGEKKIYINKEKTMKNNFHVYYTSSVKREREERKKRRKRGERNVKRMAMQK